MSHRPIPWSQIAVEGLAIVASILLAFAIDAWWEERQALDEERKLLLGLQVEFKDLRERLEYWSGINRDVISLTERFLDEGATALNQNEADFLLRGATLVNVLDQGGPLDGLIASGRLERIGDHEIRERLGKWPDWLEDMHTNDLSIREYAMREIQPFLARRGIAGQLCPGAELVCGPDRPASEQVLGLATDPEFRAHLIYRRLLAAFSVEDMENAILEADEMLALMEKRVQEMR